MFFSAQKPGMNPPGFRFSVQIRHDDLFKIYGKTNLFLVRQKNLLLY